MDTNDPGREPTEPTDAEHRAVLDRLIECYAAWEPLACVLGDVRSRDAIAALSWALSGARPMPETPAPDEELPIERRVHQVAEINRTLTARVAELEARLAVAVDDIESWGAYASEYFQAKHKFAECLAGHRAFLSPGKEPTDAE